MKNILAFAGSNHAASINENFDSKKNIITNKIENEKLDKVIQKFMNAFCQAPQTVLN